MKNVSAGMSQLRIPLLCTLLFTAVISAHDISLAEHESPGREVHIQYGDPGPPPVPDTPLAPEPGEIEEEDPALSGDSVIGGALHGTGCRERSIGA